MRIVRDAWRVPIRLPRERWRHVADRHPEMHQEEERILETVGQPDYVLAGDWGSLMAVRFYERTPLTRKHCVVVYRHARVDDGFIITAYFASAIPRWRRVVWPE
jgi:hypothetical protein